MSTLIYDEIVGRFWEDVARQIPMFSGLTRGEDIEEWLREAERIAHMFNCREDQKMALFENRLTNVALTFHRALLQKYQVMSYTNWKDAMIERFKEKLTSLEYKRSLQKNCQFDGHGVQNMVKNTNRQANSTTPLIIDGKEVIENEVLSVDLKSEIPREVWNINVPSTTYGQSSKVTDVELSLPTRNAKSEAIDMINGRQARKGDQGLSSQLLRQNNLNDPGKRQDSMAAIVDERVSGRGRSEFRYHNQHKERYRRISAVRQRSPFSTNYGRTSYQRQLCNNRYSPLSYYKNKSHRQDYDGQKNRCVERTSFSYIRRSGGSRHSDRRNRIQLNRSYSNDIRRKHVERRDQNTSAQASTSEQRRVSFEPRKYSTRSHWDCKDRVASRSQSRLQ